MARIVIDLPDQFSFSVTLAVRVTDLNYGNHVGNDNMLSLLHEARIQYYRHLGFKNEIAFVDTVGQIITDAAIVYKAEAFLGDELVIELAAADFSKYGFDLLYRVTQERTGKEVARGKTGIVCFDYSTRKVTAVPEVVLEKLRAHPLPRP